jgi:hypothetical protein
MVLLIAAAVMRALDGVPALLRGEPRTVRRYDTIDAFERDTRTQLLLPFYFPDTLAWPPSAVYWAGGDGRPTSVTFADRASGQTHMIVAQCLDGECVIPSRLLPPGRELERTTTQVAGSPADVLQRANENGRRWTEVTWRQYGRRVVLRLYGGNEDVLRIARSFRRGPP